MVYTAFEELERFGRIYTGGRVHVSHDSCYAVCVCGDELKVLDVSAGKVVPPFESASCSVSEIE